MLIDWFTVISQALNFLLLVWLMKRFLYRPILSAIETREKKIADEITQTKKEQEKTNALKIEFQKKSSDIDNAREVLMKKGQDEANQEKKKMLEQIKQEAEESRKKWHESLTAEQKTTTEKIQTFVREETLSIAGKALKDLANVQIEDSMMNIFLERLQDLSPDDLTAFELALKDRRIQPIVQSAFGLTHDQQKMLQKSFQKTFHSDITLHFETSPALVSGIRLTINGKRIEWTIANYVDSLGKKLIDLVKLPEASPP